MIPNALRPNRQCRRGPFRYQRRTGTRAEAEDAVQVPTPNQGVTTLSPEGSFSLAKGSVDTHAADVPKLNGSLWYVISLFR